MPREKEGLKLFNVRYLPLFAAFIILGIFCVKVSVLVAAILWIVAAFCAAALFFTKSVKWGVAVALVAVMLFGYGIARLDLYVRNEVGLTETAKITCRVTEVTETVSEDDEDKVIYSVTADRLKAANRMAAGSHFKPKPRSVRVTSLRRTARSASKNFL